MGWTAPRTWTSYEIVTAAFMNAHVRDNLRYLKGIGQIPTVESGLIIYNGGNDEYIKPPLLSTAECTSVLDEEGKVAFDEQTHLPKFYNGSNVKSANLLNDCQIASEAQGDILYRGAADWARLAAGTSGQLLASQGAGAAPQWAEHLGGTYLHKIIYGYSYNAIGQGAWAIGEGNVINIGYMYNSSVSDLDNISYEVYLPAGTYRMGFWVETGPSFGILDVDVEGVEKGSVDLYTASPAVWWKEIAGIVVATSGVQTITMRVDDNNIASSGFVVFFGAIHIGRNA